MLHRAELNEMPVEGRIIARHHVLLADVIPQINMNGIPQVPRIHWYALLCLVHNSVSRISYGCVHLHQQLRGNRWDAALVAQVITAS
jgi:hypothetical protein